MTSGKGEHEPPVGRLELLDGPEVPLDGLAHGQPEPVTRLHFVVPPGEVCQPQALDSVAVPRQLGITNLDVTGRGCHLRSLLGCILASIVRAGWAAILLCP